jgi:hypothetical protein
MYIKSEQLRITVNYANLEFRVEKTIFGSGYIVMSYRDTKFIETEDFNSIPDAMRYISDYIAEEEVLARGSFN